MRQSRCYCQQKKEFKETYCKRRIEDDIARFWKNLSQIEDWHKRRWKNIKRRRKDKLRKKYCINVKEFKTVPEELKPRIKAKTGKLKRFKARVTQNR